MMYQTGTFKLASIKKPQMQVLELPYAGNKLSMIILLPVGAANLEQVGNTQEHLPAARAGGRVHTHPPAHTLHHMMLYSQSLIHDLSSAPSPPGALRGKAQ